MSTAGAMPRRILLITLSNIGDLVMTTPVLQVLHQQDPDALVDLVADRRSSALLEACPWRGDILHKDKGGGWRGLLALVRRLRRHRYELIVDLRTDGLSWLLRGRRRLERRGLRLEGLHAVQRHLAVLRELAPAEPPPPRLWSTTADQAAADRLLAGLPRGPWLGLGPGANWPPKVWPVAGFQALARGLRERVAAVVLFGGPADRAACRALADALSLPLVDLAGRTSLPVTLAALRRLALFVGNDSGLGHMAAAAGVPVLTLFGPGDPERYRPWGTANRWLSSPSGRMADLSADQVVAVAAGMLEADRCG